MKIKKIIATVAAVFALGTSAFAFEWSEFWKNYGGGIEKGDMILSAGTALSFSSLEYLGSDGGYCIPPILADFEIAQPIWVLPFTFGGFAGVEMYGNTKYWSYFYTTFGGLAKYHVQLPPEKLDVYVGLKLGASARSGTYNGEGGGTDFGWGFYWGTCLGATWYFTDMIGVNAELGYPYTRVAVSFKF